MVGCSKGQKGCLLHVIGWNMDQNKMSEYRLNRFSTKIVSDIFIKFLSQILILFSVVLTTFVDVVKPG